MDEEQMDELNGEEPVDEAQYEELTRFLRRAVNEATGMADGEAFQAWMRKAAPQLLPDLLARLPDDQARKSFTQEFGRSLWNSIPLPDNGFRPRPLPVPERNDTCPCGSGKKYKKCCSQWSEGAPELDAEGVWMLMAEELPLEQVEAMGASGRVPRSVLGGVATALLDNDEAQKALALVRPLFERPERLDDRDAASLNTLLEAYDALDLQEERWAEAERLAGALRPPLRAVLWENLARAYAVEGEMEEAWSLAGAGAPGRPREPGARAAGGEPAARGGADGRGAGEGALLAGPPARGGLERAGVRVPGAGGGERGGDPAPVLLRRRGGRAHSHVGASPRQLQATGGRLPDRAGGGRSGRGAAGAHRGAAEAGGRLRGGVLSAGGRPRLRGRGRRGLGSLGRGTRRGVARVPRGEPREPWTASTSWRTWPTRCPRSSPTATASSTGRCSARILDRGLAILRRALDAHPGIVRLPGELEPNGSALALIVSAAAQAHRFGETDQARERLEWLRTLEPHSLEDLAGEEGEDLEDEDVGSPPSIQILFAFRPGRAAFDEPGVSTPGGGLPRILPEP